MCQQIHHCIPDPNALTQETAEKLIAKIDALETLISAERRTIEIPNFSQIVSDDDFDIDDENEIMLASGAVIPKVAVTALNDFELKWPGATLSMARPAIVYHVIDSIINAQKEK